MDPLWIKFLHILGAVVLFGTGLGTAFQMWAAHRAPDVRVLARVTRQVVWADWLFTTPAVFVQPLSGLWLIYEAGYELTEGWVLWALVLFVAAGLCWLPVVALQMRMANIAEAAAQAGADLPALYFKLYRCWFILGWPAFAALLGVFYLMIFKPDL